MEYHDYQEYVKEEDISNCVIILWWNKAVSYRLKKLKTDSFIKTKNDKSAALCCHT